jgi:hypothetical protein
MQHKSEGKSKGKELITVRGVVTPSEWDMRDEVTAVTIYALDETEYVVSARPMVKRLMKYMDDEIEAHGYVTQDEYGSEVFVVADFAPLDVAEDDAEKAEDWEEDDEVLDETEDWEEGDEEGGAEDQGEEGWESKDDDADGGAGGGRWKARRRR